MTTTKVSGLYAPDGSTYVVQTDGAGNVGGLTGSNTVVYIDRSGTITSGGVAQTIAAANSTRNGFLIQNNSIGDLWLSSLGTAAATQPSLWIPPGTFYQFEGVPLTALSLFGATTGQAFTAREW